MTTKRRYFGMANKAHAGIPTSLPKACEPVLPVTGDLVPQVEADYRRALAAIRAARLRGRPLITAPDPWTQRGDR